MEFLILTLCAHLPTCRLFFAVGDRAYLVKIGVMGELGGRGKDVGAKSLQRFHAAGKSLHVPGQAWTARRACSARVRGEAGCGAGSRSRVLGYWVTHPDTCENLLKLAGNLPNLGPNPASPSLAGHMQGFSCSMESLQ